MTIRLKLALLFLITVVVPMTLAAINVSSKTMEHSRTQFEQHALQEMQLVSLALEQFVSSVESDVSFLASHPVLRNINVPLQRYLDPTARSSDSSLVGGVEEEIQDFFNRYVDASNYLTDIYFGMHDGGFVGWGDAPLGGFDPRERPWYGAAIAEHDSVSLTEPYVGTTGDPMISAVSPVIGADGTLIGVLAVDVTLHELTNLVNAATVGSSGYLLLIDSGGTVIADPVHPENVNRKTADIDSPVYRNLVKDASPVVAVDTADGVKSIVSYLSTGTGWQLLTVIDDGEILSSERMLTRGIWTATIVMAVFFTVIGILFANRILAPINRISDGLRKIVQGETDDAAELESSSNDEVGELCRQFNLFRKKEQEKQQDLLRANKLEAIGQLAAGVAHEINTPVQYVSDNVAFITGALHDIEPVLADIPKVIELARQQGAPEDSLKSFVQRKEEADLEFLLEELPSTLAQSSEGLARIASIVGAMKDFTHPGHEMEPADMNRCISSTVSVARNEWKFVADVELKLDDAIPEVKCIPSMINQVILNLIVNAAHAIDEQKDPDSQIKGKISISTRQVDQHVEIKVADTGCGMTAETLERIFDPFFTTKDVGKGTGQGLSMAYQTIVEQHDGELDVSSEQGIGTTFVIRLPIWKDKGKTAEVAA